MFIPALCAIFPTKLRCPKNKGLYDKKQVAFMSRREGRPAFASRERGIQLEPNYPRPWKFWSPATQKVNYSYEREMRELTGYADDLKIPATSL